MKRSITDYFQTKAKPPQSKLAKFSTKAPSKPPLDELRLEYDTLGPTWLVALEDEMRKPYFLGLKRWIKAQQQQGVTMYPPPRDVYSWSRLTPLDEVKVVILGQDPYHNVGQAHGLAFSVAPPTPPPPSLQNIYKELRNCYPDFVPPRTGSLVGWAEQGVLLLNACLTVTAHQANSHSGRGWEQFTEQVLKVVLARNKHVVIMAWGSPAAKRVAQVRPGSQHLVLRSVHPSPLSASRGWFGSAHFKKGNEWLEKQGLEPVDWTRLESRPTRTVKETVKDTKKTNEQVDTQEKSVNEQSHHEIAVVTKTDDKSEVKVQTDIGENKLEKGTETTVDTTELPTPPSMDEPKVSASEDHSVNSSVEVTTEKKQMPDL